MLNSQKNRKAADRLADIREQIRELEEEEYILRHEFIEGGHSLVGDEYQVVITIADSERVDTKAIRRVLSPKELKPYLKKVSTTYVRTEKRHGPTSAN